MITKNDKGEYALYDQGKLIGYAPVEMIGGVRVLRDMKPKIMAMIEAAAQDGIKLTLAAGLRTWEEQYNLRKQNVIDKTKVKDDKYLTEQPASMFKPMTGKPGYSNHQDGKAYDFNVTGFPQVYSWLVKNAHRFGFVRTVQSERWHWEYLPGVGQFNYVAKNDPTWDSLTNS